MFNEPDSEVFAKAMAMSPSMRMSAANWFEAAMAVDRRLAPAARPRFDTIVQKLAIQIEPITAEHARLARQAWSDFGRGRHPAKLNFGDCLAYALAKATGEPLLFKGNDFSQTDIEPALKA